MTAWNIKTKELLLTIFFYFLVKIEKAVKHAILETGTTYYYIKG